MQALTSTAQLYQAQSIQVTFATRSGPVTATAGAGPVAKTSPSMLAYSAESFSFSSAAKGIGAGHVFEAKTFGDQRPGLGLGRDGNRGTPEARAERAAERAERAWERAGRITERALERAYQALEAETPEEAAASGDGESPFMAVAEAAYERANALSDKALMAAEQAGLLGTDAGTGTGAGTGIGAGTGTGAGTETGTQAEDPVAQTDPQEPPVAPAPGPDTSPAPAPVTAPVTSVTASQTQSFFGFQAETNAQGGISVSAFAFFSSTEVSATLTPAEQFAQALEEVQSADDAGTADEDSSAADNEQAALAALTGQSESEKLASAKTALQLLEDANGGA